jgi:CRISPR-associated exonuclease Cas4
MSEWLPVIALLALALLLLALSWLRRTRSGLPEARVVYADDAHFQRLSAPLSDAQLGLIGKPDYILKLRDGTAIPVEVKSTRAPNQPYETHLIQLAAYCRLVEASMGARPPYGLLRYADRTFQVDYTPELETRLRTLIGQARAAEGDRSAPNRSHHQPGRCQGCGFRSVCDQKL